MQIQGLQKMTLLDYPGRVACTVFLSGCNFRCPFCHNSELLDENEPGIMDDAQLLRFLESRKGILEGVAFTGGEPLMRKDLPELLDRAYRAVVKINREELAKVTGESSVGSGLTRLFQHPSLEFAAITDGPEQATAATRERRWTFALPVLDHILSPIGCGDTCGAVMAGELLAGARPEDAFAAGLAAASANCLTELYGDFRPEDAAKIRAGIRTVEVTAK